jgi:hypothetical protein
MLPKFRSFVRPIIRSFVRLFIVPFHRSSFVHSHYSPFIVRSYDYSPSLFTITIHRYYSPALFIIVTIHRYYWSKVSIASFRRCYSSLLFIGHPITPNFSCSSIMLSSPPKSYQINIPVIRTPVTVIFLLVRTFYLVTHPRFLQVEPGFQTQIPIILVSEFLSNYSLSNHVIP